MGRLQEVTEKPKLYYMDTITNEVAEKEFEPYYLIEETADEVDYYSIDKEMAKELDWEEDQDLSKETSFKEGPLFKRRADAFRYMLDQRMSDKFSMDSYGLYCYLVTGPGEDDRILVYSFGFELYTYGEELEMMYDEADYFKENYK